MSFRINNLLQMTSRYVERIGELIKTLEVHIHIPVSKQNLQTGKMLQNLYSLIIGIFVDNIPIQNIEGPYMEHIYQEKT